MAAGTNAKECIQRACDAYGLDGARNIFSELISSIVTTTQDLRLDSLTGLRVLIADFDDYSLPGRSDSTTTPREPFTGTIDTETYSVVEIALDSSKDSSEISKKIGSGIAHEIFHLYFANSIPGREENVELADYLYACIAQEGAAVQYEVERYGDSLTGTDFFDRFVDISEDEYRQGVNLLRSLTEGLTDENGQSRFHSFLMEHNRLGYRMARSVIAKYMNEHGIADVKQLAFISDNELAELIQEAIVDNEREYAARQ